MCIFRYIKETPTHDVLCEDKGHSQIVSYTYVEWAGSLALCQFDVPLQDYVCSLLPT